MTAFDASNRPVWRYDFPDTHEAIFSNIDQPRVIARDRGSAVFAASSYRRRRADDVIDSGELMQFDLTGRLQYAFAFDDEISMRGKRFGAPWAITAYAVEAEGPRRIAVAAHHYVWDPSLVAVLDDRFQRLGTFVHSGWIETLHWLAPDRLLVGGFSHPQDGGMAALLDPADLDGRSGSDDGRPNCEECAGGRPLVMIAMPRSEVNLASGSRFNRAVLQVTADRIVARTIEVPSTTNEPADAIFEFTRSLDLIGASFSDGYWNAHRLLERNGKLDHPAAECPDRDGPRVVRIWTPAAGWQTRRVAHGDPAR